MTKKEQIPDEIGQYLFLSNSISFEEFFLGEKLILTRIIFLPNYIDENYQVETKVGSIRINKKVRSKWDFLKYSNPKEIDFTNLVIELGKYILPNHKLTKIDPAAWTDWPGYFTCRNLQLSSSHLIYHDNNLGFEKERPVIESTSYLDKSTISSITTEYGIDLSYFIKYTAGYCLLEINTLYFA